MNIVGINLTLEVCLSACHRIGFRHLAHADKSMERVHTTAVTAPKNWANNKYRVAFLGPKEGRLQVFRYGAKENDAAPGLKLVRRE